MTSDVWSSKIVSGSGDTWGERRARCLDVISNAIDDILSQLRRQTFEGKISITSDDAIAMAERVIPALRAPERFLADSADADPSQAKAVIVGAVCPDFTLGSFSSPRTGQDTLDRIAKNILDAMG